MAGIYIHIPFCKQACHYCNFHFSTSLKSKDDLLLTIHRELKQRQGYLQGQSIETVYFGGGTPSLLSAREINEIWEIITKHYHLKENLEVTLEANPDDLDIDYLNELRTTPVNRLSIGIQSFFDSDLLFMNRAHNANHARSCIQAAKDTGFNNITIDLIYGTPTTSHSDWIKNLQTAFDFDIPHISCYALTVEPQTALAHFIKKGKIKNLDEIHSAEQFEILLEQIENHGYEQYEISNFCKPSKYAIHNTNYWKGKHYLGIGPAAHSFNGHSRQWNIAHNSKYIKAIQTGNTYWETEVLTCENQYNEYIMTSLRTKWGVNANQLMQWGDLNSKSFLKLAETYINDGLMELRDTNYVLNSKGKLLADTIISDFFIG
ncbi:radical SAM family heme chaperone HemW [Aureispira]|nr:radical SAM family heme chaperone HemW [Aureispira sp.]